MYYVAEYDEEGGILFVDHKGSKKEAKEYKCLNGGVGFVYTQEAIDSQKHWVSNGAIKKKAVQPIEYQVNGLVLTLDKIAKGTTVIIGAEFFIVDGDVIEITAGTPGLYTIELLGSPKYLDTTFEVEIA